MHENSDLKKAARWYRAAAVNDFPGASLKLAKALTALAAVIPGRYRSSAVRGMLMG